ncbi:MAG: GAF domain-containing protein [Erysipelotrichaceae bacterium]|nr:GAF domain-containing protein [Erysipelotrichaceae bacterium]
MLIHLNKNNELVLGPFQGHPACVRIPFNRGVCGKAASTKTVQRIDNVHLFPGHIACDSASNSELVIPLIKDGNVIGVLDIDSPVYSRFDTTDITWLSKIVELLTNSIHD